MTLSSKNDSVSTFNDGKLKPGPYKIQNIASQTYVDIRERPKELCCRPAALLEGKGRWEILPSGAGYTIRSLERGQLDQFCTMLNGPGCRISVAPFPFAWRMERVHDERYTGDECIRLFWGTTNNTWDLQCGSEQDGTPIHVLDNRDSNACRIWKLIPEAPEAFDPAQQADSVPASGSGPLPPYDGNPGKQRCACAHQTTEANDDDDECETTVVETTVTTTKKTVTRRKKQRAEGE